MRGATAFLRHARFIAASISFHVLMAVSAAFISTYPVDRTAGVGTIRVILIFRQAVGSNPGGPF